MAFLLLSPGCITVLCFQFFTICFKFENLTEIPLKFLPFSLFKLLGLKTMCYLLILLLIAFSLIL